MKVGLFVPCYVDQMYPQVARAALELLEELGVNVSVPIHQTCCGQPMSNSGFSHLSGGCDQRFIVNFADFDYIVSPSGSCVLHIREHLHDADRASDAARIRLNTFELSAFLTDILSIQSLNTRFPFRVGLHQSCHAQRGLHISQMSELVAPPFSKPLRLLGMVRDIEIIELSRPDECCGFGGTFCVSEEAVSVKMGKDRVADHLMHQADYITGTDVSCLMHLEGILKRRGSGTKVIHLAEILKSSHTGI